MRKVLLVIDDIQQRSGLEAFLRRLGFDVLSAARDSQVDDALLGFQAEILIANHTSRNVDGVKLSQRVKKKVVPQPRIALSYSGTRPTLSAEDQKSVDAMMEIPAAGENAIRLLATLGGLAADPILEKYRKFANAKLSTEEQIVIITGERQASQHVTGGGAAVAEFDPKKTPGQAASIRSERSNKYDLFLETHGKDLSGGAADKVMPREQAQAHMKQLKKDAEPEKDALDEIQKQKIKFAEAMFETGKSDDKTEKKN